MTRTRTAALVALLVTVPLAATACLVSDPPRRAAPATGPAGAGGAAGEGGPQPSTATAEAELVPVVIAYDVGDLLRVAPQRPVDTIVMPPTLLHSGGFAREYEGGLYGQPVLYAKPERAMTAEDLSSLVRDL